MTTNLNDVIYALAREIEYKFDDQISAMRGLKSIINRECDRLEALCQAKPDGTPGRWPKEDIPVAVVAGAMAAVASEVQTSLVADIVRTGTRASVIAEIIPLLK
jgi:hypothetical protein